MNNLYAKVFRFSLLFFLLLLMTSSLIAQSKRELLKKGKKLFNNENYRSAIPVFEQVLAKDPDNAAALYRAGVSYIAFDKEKSRNYIYRAQRLKPRVSRDIEYWLGRIDHLNYKFDEAITHYRLYDHRLKKNDIRKKEMATLIQQSKNAKIQFNNPKDIVVKNLGPTVNTSFSEHSPVIASDDSYLLFTSRAEPATGGKENQPGVYYDDVFEARRSGAAAFTAPKPVVRVNSQYHDATIQLYDNDTKLLLYRDENNGDFFFSNREPGGEWSAPMPLDANINSRDYEGDAYITPDGKLLYFSTSHYSEEGDKDIYVSKRNSNGSWGKARNLGVIINTAADEDSPILSPDGKSLYFTSRGHNSMGGYDVFVSHFDSVGRRWRKPENMGYPVNTPDDDAYYRLSPDGSTAYLSSYRLGGYGEKDIWSINYLRNVQIRGHVYSMQDSTAVPGMELVFSGQQANKEALSYRDITKAGSGTYSVAVLSGRTYQVTVTKDGQNIASTAFEVPVTTNETTGIDKDFYVSFVDPNAGKLFTFKKIYFDSNASDLRPESVQELNKILEVLQANPQINLSIDGHSDSRNADEYNMMLGDNRAKAAYDYLVKNGISDRRLMTVSYGERRPIAPNDSPENMQLNRRTEFNLVPRAGGSTGN
jgi:outer membrane protein OmpA-like peptidoglycan-associated protein